MFVIVVSLGKYMKVNLKIFLILATVLLMLSCGSKVFIFKEYDVLLKSNILQKHQMKKDELVKFRVSGDVKFVDNFEKIYTKFYSKVIFKDKKYKSYNFECHLTSESMHDYTFGGNDPIYFLDKKIKMTKLYDSENVLSHVFYENERKTKDGFVRFSCYTKDSIDLNFLLQRFNEIEIIEKQ